MTLTENEKRSDKREKPMTKVIVRRLPPSMDQETFLNQVSPVPEYNYIYTAKGDSSLGEFAFTRVYINFINAKDIYDFKERFDSYVFLDSRGHEYPAIVEFAPFQKIPKKRGKSRVDPKCGTVESDPVFQEFLDNLNKPKEQEEKPEYTLQLTSESKNDVTTPLLEFIKNKRAQKLRIREVRREERKKRDFDKKKERYDDRKKISDERHTSKVVSNASSSKVETIKEEKSDVNSTVPTGVEKIEKVYEKSYYKSKEKKYEERRYEEKRRDIKPRYPKKEYHDNRDSRRQEEYRERDNRSKYDDYKKEEKSFTKKVKKYSERREERKMEAQKLEHKSDVKESKNNSKESSEKSLNDVSESNINKTAVTKAKSSEEKKDEDTEAPNKERKPQSESKVKETESQYQKRIRNKDRPTIAIYRPGMLSKRRQNEDKDSSESKDKQSEQK